MDAHASSSARPYILILGILLFLTVVTVVAAGINFGSPSVNVVIAMAIATVKASLVALYFMHLRHDKPMNSIIFVSGVICLGVFLAFCLMDTDTRDPVRPSNLKVPVVPTGAAAPPPAAAPAAPAQPHH